MQYLLPFYQENLTKMRSFRKFNAADYHISKKLREFRISCAMSQKELAELTGVSFQQIQKYETTENKINASKLFEFAQILNKPIAAFYEGLKYDGRNYNYELTSEKQRQDDFDLQNKEILRLVRSFTRIKEKNVKKRVLALIEELAGPFYRKEKKHSYN